ncbi:anti-sigma factor domain-containing protein [Ornithinibacillus salinisoli]|uniref:Anti-sigma factor domain-containing protein n=1 Tax=Ornithinibacillus salinisoli TaxID=1848459 RepID=A0ABW4VVV6_9BACI
MSKGIVMEHHRKYTVVMTKDGLFQRAYPINNSDIGAEVEFKPLTNKKRIAISSILQERKMSLRIVSLACVFALLMIPLLMIVNQDKTYAYVDIDINPSVELEIDNELRVSSLVPLNEDASKIAKELEHIKGKKIATAIELVIQQAEKSGLSNIDKNVLVGINYVKGDDTSLLEIIDGYFSEDPNYEWQVVTMQIPSEMRDTAREMKQSMNQVLAKSIDEDKQSTNIDDSVSNDEIEIIQSFYNDKNEENLVIDENIKDEDEKNESSSDESKKDVDEVTISPTDKDKHPSESQGKKSEKQLKGKKNENKLNGINKQKSNQNQLGKQKSKKEEFKHNKEKENGKKGKREQKGNNKGKEHKKEKDDNKHNKKNKHKHKYEWKNRGN